MAPRRNLWAEYYKRRVSRFRWQADISAWCQGVDEWRGYFEVRLDERPPTLTPEHQAAVKAMVDRLHEVGGYSYSELNAAFHVGKYSEIPDSEWEHVSAFLQLRIRSYEATSTGEIRVTGSAKAAFSTVPSQW